MREIVPQASRVNGVAGRGQQRQRCGGPICRLDVGQRASKDSAHGEVAIGAGRPEPTATPRVQQRLRRTSRRIASAGGQPVRQAQQPLLARVGITAGAESAGPQQPLFALFVRSASP